MKLYKQIVNTKTTIKVNEATEGESLENRLERIQNNEEGIIAEAPIIYTERKEGVRPEMDIRTDKWELANKAADIFSKNRNLRRQERLDKADEDKKAQQNLRRQADSNEGGETAT